jgi:hypothetical protein
VRTVTWVPAFAGMTLMLVIRFQLTRVVEHTASTGVTPPEGGAHAHI